ncbi:hypothetical protein [Aestuariivivens sediminis]|uniref:hypothetical protein n=1 Tax=Aestuariivivens sediminis TaxID=2913557 RepID=UPI001F5AB1AE|nr:hypothetical protein [Aestuariivivens sediminis]
MKSNVLKLVLLFTSLYLTPMLLSSQNETKSNLYQLEYILPKIGEESLFTKAVKAHNEAYHSSEPFEATINLVMTGDEAGWYVWEMGPTSFKHLDNRPDNEEHNNDWNTTVAPHIKKYGRTEYWGFNEKLSYVSLPNESIKYAAVWFLKIKKGVSNEKLSVFINRLRNVNEKLDSDMREFYNLYGPSDSDRAIAFVFPKTKLADLEVNIPFKKKYEELHGDGSWEESMALWRDYFPVVTRELWEFNAY